MATTNIRVDGWYQTSTDGIPTIHLSIVDEGMVTRSTDTPASTVFRPRILDPELFSIKRRPQVWPWVGEKSALQNAAFGQLRIDNYDGAFDFLLAADLRDAAIVFQLPPAMAFGGATTVSTAPIVATAILDDVVMDDEDVVTITLKDTLARLDRPLNVVFNAPFVEEGAANQSYPLSFGALRNVKPQLIDEPNRLYRLHDAAITNLTAVRDQGALLDVHVQPPQVAPALNNSGIQLETLPFGKLTADFSSKGAQTIIPGAADVLGGVGELRSTTESPPGVTTWTGAADTNPPSGWTYVNPGGTYGTYVRALKGNGYPQDWSMRMVTDKMYDPSSNTYGLPMYITTPMLLPGKTYRISIVLDKATPPGGYSQWDGTWGLMLRTDSSSRGHVADISGSSYGSYLNGPEMGSQSYSFIYTVPNDGVARSIHVVCVGKGYHYGPAGVSWHGLKAELLGQYIDLPLEGIGLQDYFTEILYNRAGEDTSVWSSADLSALDTDTAYEFGEHYDAPPNILDALRAPLDSYCAALFTDALGVLRVRRLVDPRLYASSAVAAFDLTSTKRPISVYPDRAQYLTTLFGARRNISPYADADFVSDFAAVPADLRERFKRDCQFQVYATRSPAGQYRSAINAPPLNTSFDLASMAQTELDRVVGIFSPTTYADGTISNGKRNFVQFTVYFDDVLNVATSASPVAAYNLLFGDVVLLTYPPHGFNNVPVAVVGTELFPFAQKLIIWGFY